LPPAKKKQEQEARKLQQNGEDWRSIDSDEPPTKRAKKSADADFQEYYATLKDHVNNIPARSKNQKPVPLTVELLPNNKATLQRHLQIKDGDIFNSQCQDTIQLFEFGYALAKLKDMYFTKCVPHTNETNIFDVLKCKGCTKVSNGNTFFKDLKKLNLKSIDVVEDNINFFVRFAGLCVLYPKFKLIPWNSTKIKQYMVFLGPQLQVDEVMWK